MDSDLRELLRIEQYVYFALQMHGRAGTRLRKPYSTGSKGRISQIDTLPSGSWRRV